MRTHVVLFSLFGFWFVSTTSFSLAPQLINGKPVASTGFNEVVPIEGNLSHCTATIVGPRVLITAAHCAEDAQMITFTLRGKKYKAKLTQSPDYPEKAHDLALAVVKKEIPGARPFTIGGSASIGKTLALMGYGCTDTLENGGNDGVLRAGKTEIAEIDGFRVESKTLFGSLLCPGDSGGPAFAQDGRALRLLGINTAVSFDRKTGELGPTNISVRLDHKDSAGFLKDFAEENEVSICGINAKCE